jgi:hypothetical protein
MKKRILKCLLGAAVLAFTGITSVNAEEPKDIYGGGYSTNDITIYTLNTITGNISIRNLCEFKGEKQCSSAVVYDIYTNNDLRVYTGGGTNLLGEESFVNIAAVAGATYEVKNNIFTILDVTYTTNNTDLFVGGGFSF